MGAQQNFSGFFRDFFDFNFSDRVNNEKSIFMALAGVMMVSSAARAISVTGEAGEHYTNLGVGFGTESTGLAVSGNWLHSDNDGDAAGLGLGLNIPLGLFLATVGGKKVFTPIRTSVGDEGYAAGRSAGGLQENRRQLPSVRRLLLLSGFALQRH